jgi:acylphosphatase
MNSEKMRCHVLVSGRVQGVFFRQNTRERARALGLKGWVRNTEDGKVEAVFEGEREKIEKILEWMRKGPPFARVDGLKIEWEDFKGEFDDFEIRYD